MNEAKPPTVTTKNNLSGDAQRPLFADLDALLEEDLSTAGASSSSESDASPRLTLVHGDDDDECDATAESPVEAEAEAIEQEMPDDDTTFTGEMPETDKDDHSNVGEDEEEHEPAGVMGVQADPEAAEASQDDALSAYALNESFAAEAEPPAVELSAMAEPGEPHGHEESAGLLELVSSHCDGHSAGIDISIANEPSRFAAWTAAMEPAVSTGGVGAAAKVSTAPGRIGEGKLIPSRLTWKPRELFGGAAARRADPFKWEVMLTTACVTAACGMVGIWLLRSVLA